MHHVELANDGGGVRGDKEPLEVVDDHLVASVGTERGAHDLRELVDRLDVAQHRLLDALEVLVALLEQVGPARARNLERHVVWCLGGEWSARSKKKGLPHAPKAAAAQHSFTHLEHSNASERPEEDSRRERICYSLSASKNPKWPSLCSRTWKAGARFLTNTEFSSPLAAHRSAATPRAALFFFRLRSCHFLPELSCAKEEA
ncbi:hypothetical protein L1887_47048 [Cichorium endivia]|nr:hypothetical protein L1887_47048 [Cichorium endivia]